jgi:hypothetical protein
MQRRSVSVGGPPLDEQGEPCEVVNLLHTDVRDEYQRPPARLRLQSFVLQNYTLQRLVPAATWIPAYAGKGPGGWRDNLYGDVFAGCTTAYVLPAACTSARARARRRSPCAHAAPGA